MSIVHNPDTSKIAEMWKHIDSILGPIGMTPDRASLDNWQVFSLYLELLDADNSLREVIQRHILQNQVARCILEKMVN